MARYAEWNKFIGNLKTDKYGDTTVNEVGIAFEKATADVVPRAEAENYKSIAEHQQKLSMDRYFEIKQLKKELAEAKGEVERLNTEIKILTENSISAKYPNHVLCSKGVILTKSLEKYDELIGDIASEVAREIFAEIEKVLIFTEDRKRISELKKKYTE